MKQKTLERIMGTAFLLLGIYVFTIFFRQAITFTGVPSKDAIYYAGFIFNALSFIAILIAGIALWIDSRSAQ
jgi:hypothetical protein